MVAFRFMKALVELTKQGVEKYKRSFFHTSTLQGEYVLISQRDKIAEYVKVPDDVLGFHEAANGVRIDAKHSSMPWLLTLKSATTTRIHYGVWSGFRTYHKPVVRVQLTQILKSRIPVMLDEMDLFLKDLIGSPTGDCL